MATLEPQPTTPKAFISYSWDDDVHKEWVKQLATRLRADGVDVTLDRWHAAPGEQIPAFMERAVRENDFVIAVCTPRFQERSDERGGGVGYEGDIMTAYAFTGGDKRKFIPVLRRGSWKEAAPTWLLGRAKIDLSGDPYSESEYEELLRSLHGAREAAPPIGGRPNFAGRQGLQASPSAALVSLRAGSSTPQHQSSIRPPHTAELVRVEKAMQTAESRRTGVFLSYSHVDVDRLERPKVYLENLRNRGVAQGWTDHQIKPGDDWNAEIQKALDAAGAAVLLISEDFLRSPFIRTVELPQLFKAREERGLLLLPVNLYPSTVSEYPELAGIQALNGKTKFVCDMTKSEEEDLWVRMSQEIKRAFSTSASAELPAPARVEDGRPAIFLAPAATPFLSEFRDQVEDYLVLQLPEVRILPESSGQGVLRGAFVSAMRANIERSLMFVQLLDHSRGLDYFEDAPEEGFVALLHRCALDLKTPRQVLQWRDPDKKLPRAAEGTRAHLKLLEGPTVSSAGREEFKGLIVERYRELIAPEPRAPKDEPNDADVIDKQVFINAEPTRAWRAVAESISKELTKKRKIPCVLLSERLKTQADRREMRDYCFTHCDGLLFVGGSNPNWLPEEREAYQKLKAKRKEVGKSSSVPMALCEGPPKTGPCEGPVKDCFWCDPDALREASVSVNHRLPGVEVIDCSAGVCSEDHHCRGGVCTEAFERFVLHVRGEAVAAAGSAPVDGADAGAAQLEGRPRL